MPGKLLLSALLLVTSGQSYANIIFDNGQSAENRVTWNVTAPFHGIVDDFQLNESTTITGIAYETWHNFDPIYVSTDFYIFDAPPAVGDPANGIPIFNSTALFAGTASATLTLNGLTNDGMGSPGYTHEIDGLSLTLGPGTYYLGLSVNRSAGIIAIGSGDGSLQTLGEGMIQYFGTDTAIRVGDHAAFRLIGDSAAIPAPPVLTLLFAGLATFRAFRPSKIRRF